MKRNIQQLVVALACAATFASCSKDSNSVTPPPPPPPPPPTYKVVKVSIAKTDQLDMDLTAYSSLPPGTTYELSFQNSPMETFVINNEVKKAWHLGKKEAGTYRVSIHASTSQSSSSESCFFRFNVSNGAVTRSVIPTPQVGNNYAFDLEVQP
jgi:hypothetical protein